MRYFVEVGYKGTKYAGFQVQQNADTIQGQVEKAFTTVFRTPVNMTGSSRTDAGVHALQNYFHFDSTDPFEPSWVYNVNAILPADIVVRSVVPVAADAHARFLAISREYKYFITTAKDPFLTETAWYYPYKVSVDLLNEAAALLYRFTDYTSFSKRNTQVFTRQCTISKSEWIASDQGLIFTVKANRFLRGMVRGLVGTMLLVGRKRITVSDFKDIIVSKDCTRASFATPAHGLFLVEVEYPLLAVIS